MTRHLLWIVFCFCVQTSTFAKGNETFRELKKVEIELYTFEGEARLTYDGEWKSSAKIFYAQKKRIVAYKDEKLGQCLLERVHEPKKPETDENEKSFVRVFYMPRSLMEKEEVEKIGGKRILVFCSKYPIGLLENVKNTESDSRRLKRENHNERGENNTHTSHHSASNKLLDVLSAEEPTGVAGKGIKRNAHSGLNNVRGQYPSASAKIGQPAAVDYHSRVINNLHPVAHPIDITSSVTITTGSAHPVWSYHPPSSSLHGYPQQNGTVPHLAGSLGGPGTFLNDSTPQIYGDHRGHHPGLHPSSSTPHQGYQNETFYAQPGSHGHAPQQTSGQYPPSSTSRKLYDQPQNGTHSVLHSPERSGPVYSPQYPPSSTSKVHHFHSPSHGGQHYPPSSSSVPHVAPSFPPYPTTSAKQPDSVPFTPSQFPPSSASKQNYPGEEHVHHAAAPAGDGGHSFPHYPPSTGSHPHFPPSSTSKTHHPPAGHAHSLYPPPVHHSHGYSPSSTVIPHYPPVTQAGQSTTGQIAQPPLSGHSPTPTTSIPHLGGQLHHYPPTSSSKEIHPHVPVAHLPPPASTSEGGVHSYQQSGHHYPPSISKEGVHQQGSHHYPPSSFSKDINSNQQTSHYYPPSSSSKVVPHQQRSHHYPPSSTSKDGIQPPYQHQQGGHYYPSSSSSKETQTHPQPGHYSPPSSSNKNQVHSHQQTDYHYPPSSFSKAPYPNQQSSHQFPPSSFSKDVHPHQLADHHYPPSSFSKDGAHHLGSPQYPPSSTHKDGVHSHVQNGHHHSPASSSNDRVYSQQHHPPATLGSESEHSHQNQPSGYYPPSSTSKIHPGGQLVAQNRVSFTPVQPSYSTPSSTQTPQGVTHYQPIHHQPPHPAPLPLSPQAPPGSYYPPSSSSRIHPQPHYNNAVAHHLHHHHHNDSSPSRFPVTSPQPPTSSVGHHYTPTDNSSGYPSHHGSHYPTSVGGRHYVPQNDSFAYPPASHHTPAAYPPSSYSHHFQQVSPKPCSGSPRSLYSITTRTILTPNGIVHRPATVKTNEQLPCGSANQPIPVSYGGRYAPCSSTIRNGQAVRSHTPCSADNTERQSRKSQRSVVPGPALITQKSEPPTEVNIQPRFHYSKLQDKKAGKENSTDEAEFTEREDVEIFDESTDPQHPPPLKYQQEDEKPKEEVKEGDVLEPGDTILGKDGYTILDGFRGRVVSVTGQIGKTKAEKPTNSGLFRYSSELGRYAKDTPENFSDCQGDVTFTCSEFLGSGGRAKICKPNPRRKPDGSPC